MRSVLALWAFILVIQHVCSAPSQQWPLIKPKIPLVDASQKLHQPQSRIVGGLEAAPHQFPFVVGLISTQSSGFCGGSILNKDWVLTAALCVYQLPNHVIYMGTNDIFEPDETHQITMSARVVIHPQFEYATINNNIAMVQLFKPAIFSESVQPAYILLDEQSDLSGRIATVAGWGYQSDTSGGLSEKLRYVDLELIDSFTCRQYYGLIVVTNTTVCANGIDGAIATFCAGDMGGPLLLRPTESSELSQLGVASFIASVSCQRGYPSGYERIAPHADWIIEVIGSADMSRSPFSVARL